MALDMSCPRLGRQHAYVCRRCGHQPSVSERDVGGHRVVTQLELAPPVDRAALKEALHDLFVRHRYYNTGSRDFADEVLPVLEAHGVFPTKGD